MERPKEFLREARSRLLVYDKHKAHTIEKVNQIINRECNTTLALVPPAATSKIQPLDVAFNSEFKRSVDRQATELMAEDPEIFLISKLTAGERHVLFTKWVGKAWRETSRRIKDMVIRSFVKCGIVLPTSGERDNEINIEGIPGYTIGQPCDVAEVMFYDSSDDELDMVVGSHGGEV